jgi:hypothetical protein
MEIGLYVLPGLFVLAGLYFVFSGLHRIVTGSRFADRAETVPGKVTDARLVLKGRSLPTLTFRTMAGTTITAESPIESAHAVGDEVEVSYDPGNPADARVAGTKNDGIVLVVSGTIILLGALLVLGVLLILRLVAESYSAS